MGTQLSDLFAFTTGMDPQTAGMAITRNSKPRLTAALLCDGFVNNGRPLSSSPCCTVRKIWRDQTIFEATIRAALLGTG